MLKSGGNGALGLGSVTPKMTLSRDAAPAACFTIRIEDAEHSPHLRPGNRAVIDPADGTYQHGEIYALEYSNGLSIAQALPFNHRVDCDEPCLWLHLLNRPGSREELEDRRNRGELVYTSDGPMRMSYFNEIVIGRVIGVRPATPDRRWAVGSLGPVRSYHTRFSNKFGNAKVISM